MRIIPAVEFSVEQVDRAIDIATQTQAQSIVDRVRGQGTSAVREYAIQFNERSRDQPLWMTRPEMESAVAKINPTQLELLRRVAERIRKFAKAQLDCLSSLTTEIPGGRAGHTIEPIERVGCYAPAGRFPLPSTVLMTAMTANVAGCQNIVVATPNPSNLMLAAAWIAGADEVLAVGGAHAIASMAYGLEDHPRCDLIVGPGNRWVTAAKKLVSGEVGIDMLAGPSELVLVVDDSAAPEMIAADLLAQAEHDVDARAMLVTDCQQVAEAVVAQVEKQLQVLPTAETARQSIGMGAIIVCDSIAQGDRSAVEIANQLAPEHLEIHCRDAASVARQIRHAGCVFIGSRSAEVFGDYGAGPNHTLPTAGTARWSAGLNVFTFLRVRTWLAIEDPPELLIDDTCQLAELEGLIGHARASACRRQIPSPPAE